MAARSGEASFRLLWRCIESVSPGIISVRYPVDDLQAYRQQIELRGVAVDYAASGVTIGAIGTADLFAVRDPDGNITEFYEKTD